MGRLRELLDELAATRLAARRADDRRSEASWDNEGGSPQEPDGDPEQVGDPAGDAQRELDLR